LFLFVEFRYLHFDLLPRHSPQLLYLRYSPLDMLILGSLVQRLEKVHEELRRFVALSWSCDTSSVPTPLYCDTMGEIVGWLPW